MTNLDHKALTVQICIIPSFVREQKHLDGLAQDGRGKSTKKVAYGRSAHKLIVFVVLCVLRHRHDDNDEQNDHHEG